MKKLAGLVVLFTISLVTINPVAASVPGAHRMKISILSSTGPRTVKASTDCTAKSGHILTVHVKVSGVQLIHATTAKPVRGKAHIQAYLDRIPSQDYSKFTTTNWLWTGTSTNFPLCLTPALLHNKKGKHSILVVLAKTDGVLFRGVRPSKLHITVR